MFKQILASFVLVLTLGSVGALAQGAGDECNAAFTDAGLQAAVTAALQGSLNCETLAELTLLDASGLDIKSLAGLENAAGLTALYLNDNQITDLTPLEALSGLEVLRLNANGLTDDALPALRQLNNLKELRLDGNNLSDIYPLFFLGSLEMLSLRNNAVDNIYPVSSLPQLEFLLLGSNPLTAADLRPLRSASSLRRLELGYLGLTDTGDIVALFAKPEQADTLFLVGNELTTVAGLADLPNLRTLHLSINPLEDVSGLADLTALYDLQLAATGVKTLASLTALNELKRLGLANNNVADISALLDNNSLADGAVLGLQGSCVAEDDPNLLALQARGVTVTVTPSDSCP